MFDMHCTREEVKWIGVREAGESRAFGENTKHLTAYKFPSVSPLPFE